MLFIENTYDENFYRSNILDFYFKDLKIGVLDIETTGLNPEKNKIVIGGLLTPQGNELKVQQFFLDTKEEEPQLLNAYLSSLADVDILVSYNGDHFDLPFINRRIRANHYSNNFPISHQVPGNELSLYQSLDLYKVISRYSPLKKLLPNLKQKTVESFMGLWSDRSDRISGEESVDLYYEYVKTADPCLREIMLLHNRDDILQLSRLLKILDKLDFHQIMFHTGFTVSEDNKKVLIKKILFKKDHLSLSGVHRNIPMDYRNYGISHEAVFSNKTSTFTISIPYRSGKGYTYVNLDDFGMDFSGLEKYSGFRNGYLILKEDTQINFAEINHLIQLILKGILKEF